jgi:hypothetical protein
VTRLLAVLLGLACACGGKPLDGSWVETGYTCNGAPGPETPLPTQDTFRGNAGTQTVTTTSCTLAFPLSLNYSGASAVSITQAAPECSGTCATCPDAGTTVSYSYTLSSTTLTLTASSDPNLDCNPGQTPAYAFSKM